MRNALILAVTAFFLASCVSTNPIPKGYTGPLAYIEDSFAPRDGKIIDVFILAKVNDVEIAKTIATDREQAQQWGGIAFSGEPRAIGRDVPAQEATFTIVAGTFFPIPLLSLTAKRRFYIEGTVRFAPQPNRKYVVKGKLGEDYCGVWLEDAATGEVVDKKTEFKGASYSSKWDGRILTEPAPEPAAPETPPKP